ncbi:MAG: hypothetical protein HUJ30_02290 [Gammaproteobacteria bacterium]|nr:hypothetical protein [Gammaproteobacteria bacterium]
MDREQQESRIKLLIAKGKEQGYLTYAEVNDHLPDDIVDPEQVEDIITTINDMGIEVHEQAPDAESLLMSDNAVSTDEDAAEEAAAALAALDSDFGRTTDPVRMYMREMGAVDLLTREGEIVIAKRIEEGMGHMMSALANYSETVGHVLGDYKRVIENEGRLSEVITGFVDPNEEEFVAAPAAPPAAEGADVDSDDDEEEEAVDLGPDPEETAERFAAIEKLYDQIQQRIASKGHGGDDLKAMRLELAEMFLELKLPPKTVDLLVMNMRDLVDRIRYHEKSIMKICVNQAKMPRKQFVTTFPENETDAGWLDKQLDSDESYVAVLKHYEDDIRRAQAKLTAIEQESGMSISDLKEINRKMSIGEAKARRAKKEMVEANLRLVISIDKK